MSAPKDTKNKLNLNKLDLGMLAELLCPAYAEGDVKYYPESWREGFPASVTISAALRHIDSFQNGEDHDLGCLERFGIHKLHLGAAIFALLSTYNSLKIDSERFDDRWKKMQSKRQQEYKEKALKNNVQDYIENQHVKTASITNTFGITVKPIEPGVFIMGSPELETGRYDDEIQHEVIITKGFYMQTTPVTQGQWQQIMGYNPSSFKTNDNHPVENVSWDDVKNFIDLLNSRIEGATYRLPTEAEWEYACRAGSNTAYANGNSLYAMGWHDKNSGGKTHQVAQKKPNAWGLYDMHGNVWEWCEDWYGSYPSVSVTDPQGASSGSYRVNRGGGWRNLSRICRSAYRNYESPGVQGSALGFRLAMDIDK